MNMTQHFLRKLHLKKNYSSVHFSDFLGTLKFFSKTNGNSNLTYLIYLKNTYFITSYSSQYTGECGILSVHHQIWSTIDFLGRWLRISVSFLWKMCGNPLNLQKLPLKRGIFDIFKLWVSRFGPYGFFGSPITNSR